MQRSVHTFGHGIFHRTPIVPSALTKNAVQPTVDVESFNVQLSFTSTAVSSVSLQTNLSLAEHFNRNMATAMKLLAIDAFYFVVRSH